MVGSLSEALVIYQEAIFPYRLRDHLDSERLWRLLDVLVGLAPASDLNLRHRKRLPEPDFFSPSYWLQFTAATTESKSQI